LKKIILVVALMILLVGCFATALPVQAKAVPPVRITISTPGHHVNAGAAITFSVTGYYADGSHFDISSYCDYSLNDPTAAGGSWSGNTYTSATIGRWDVTAVYRYDKLAPATTYVIVDRGAPVSIAISPTTFRTYSGNVVKFTATATDAGGNTFNVSSGTNFDVEKGAGGSWKMNTYNSSYTTEVPGTWTVTATCGSLPAATATLTVLHGPAVSIALSPSSGSVKSGSSFKFNAIGTDAWGNTFSVSKDATFTIDAGAGGSWTMDSYNGVYHSAVKGTWTVTAAYGSLHANAPIIVK
jgi:hypothetical protein